MKPLTIEELRSDSPRVKALLAELRQQEKEEDDGYVDPESEPCHQFFDGR